VGYCYTPLGDCPWLRDADPVQRLGDQCRKCFALLSGWSVVEDGLKERWLYRQNAAVPWWAVGRIGDEGLECGLKGEKRRRRRKRRR